jgi:hypothetical protein
MNNKSKYNSKAKDSFKTKFNIYLFGKILNDKVDSIAWEDISAFDLEANEKLRAQYTTEYYQYEETELIDKKKSIKEIYQSFKEWKEKNIEEYKRLELLYIESFEKVFLFKEFELMIKSDECCYCEVTESKIILLSDKNQLFKKNLRGWNMEVERFDSNLEYTKDNCAMACYWCNNAKTDEFTKEEFQPIADQIKLVWETRLAEK